MYLNVLTLLTVFMLSNAIEETGGDVGDPCGDDNILIEHDIAIPKKEYFSHMFRKRRAVTSNQEKKWPNAIVPYTINKELNSYQHDVIKKAISHWEEHTCIRFVEHKKQQDYVEFAHGNCGCCSLVGRRGDGRQQVSLDVICTEFGIVVHEIGHVIGFWHEHNRPDRDKFVKIYAENIKHDKKDRFIKKNTLEINSYGQAYDYNSIMHYRRNTNSRNGKDTIEPRMHDVEIGQRDGLSQSDVIQARELYQCPKPACSYTLTEPEGVLKSPYFPYNYPKNHECHWVIKTPPDSKVILKFIKFDMEYTEVCGFDYLEIRLGLHSTSPLYDIYCGDELPEPVVSHSGLWMKFRSDDSIVRCGFMANYSIVPMEPTITSGSGDQLYTSNVGDLIPQNDGYPHPRHNMLSSQTTTQAPCELICWFFHFCRCKNQVVDVLKSDQSLESSGYEVSVTAEYSSAEE